jgi:hypothetical protein
VTTPPEQPQNGDQPGKRSKEQIEADIEATRVQLGNTVDQLSHRLDVKSRLQEQVRQRRAQAVHELHATGERMRQQPVIPGAVAAGMLLVTTLLVLRGRRRRRPRRRRG